MNPIEALKRDIERALSRVEVKLRRPREQDGRWWLDATYDDHVVTIEWSPHRGFGVSADGVTDGYGEGPDEIFTDREVVANRVIALLTQGAGTNPPAEVALRELRAVLGFTQEQLAIRLGVQQAAVSRLERRPDITLSSLRRYVEALGGQLEINVRTPDGEHLRLLDSGQRMKARAACGHVMATFFDTKECQSNRPSDVIGDILGEFEDTARTQWGLITPGKLLLDETMDTEVATADIDGVKISVNDNVVSCFVKMLENMATTSGIPDFQIGKKDVAVYRYLLGHEIGHFVPCDSFHPASKCPELRADAIAGWLAGHAGDDPAPGSIVASMLGCRVDECAHPTSEQRSFAFLMGHSEGLRERASSAAKIKLLVLRVSDLEISRSFYTHLGLDLIPERHGAGPLHYSCTMQETVLELYPCADGIRSSRLRFGLRTQKQSIDRLRSSGLLKHPPRVIRSQPRSEVYLVRDPDDNAIEVEVAA